MRILIITFFLMIQSFLYAENLEIVKYVGDYTPKIYLDIDKKFPNKLVNILKIDSKLIDNYKIVLDSKELNSSDFKLSLTYSHNKLLARLENLKSGAVVLYKRYKIPKFDIYPFLIHYLSYDLNNKLGFDEVPWIKRKLVYSVYMAPKESAIFISDITLKYRKRIISGGLNVFPKWANREQTELYYTKFLEKGPILYKYNIFTGQRSRIFDSKGMLIVSDVQGDNLLLTLAIDEQPDIYLFNTKNRSLQQITKYSGIDVNGQFYEDGIIFISDRLGYPNVYLKDKSGGVSRFVYHGRNHISVSAYKNLVVLSSRETNKAFDNNTFNLFLIDKNRDKLKRLTYGGKNMLPTFCDNGNTILFIKESKFSSKFGIIRLRKNRIFYTNLNRRIQGFDF